MWNDIQFAWRTLRRSPGFALLTVLTLATGIGANTAIFSLLYQVVLRSVPVKSPESLVFLQSDPYKVGWARADNSKSVFSYPMYRELRDRNQVFSGVVARAMFPVTAASGGDAFRATAEVVTGNFFDVLGIKPASGRLLISSDDSPNAQSSVVVLGYSFWTGQMGSDANIVNRQIRINGHPALVAGIAPRGFRGIVSGNDPDFYAPLSMMKVISPGWENNERPDAYWLNLVGRLKPNVSEQQANAQLLPLFRSILSAQIPQFKGLEQDSRQKMLAKTLVVLPAAQGLNEMREQWQAPLVVLMVMVGLVLLIACANVANLLIARASARQREISIRLAIGATQGQIFRQLLVESLLLSLAGGGIGLIASESLVNGLLALLPASTTSGWISSDLDLPLLGFSFAVSLLTGILFGLLPAWQTTRPDVASTLKEQSGSVSGGGSQTRSRQFLVVAQVCLSLLLLIGAGLFTRSLVNLLSQNPGFRPEHLITFTIDPSLNGYTRGRSIALFRQIQERLKQLPGVTSVAHAEISPFGGMNWGSGVKAPGSRTASEQSLPCSENSVSAGYFRTLGITLMAGREVEDADAATSPKVAIVNETLARRLFEGANPIGRRITSGPDDTSLQIVGMVRDSKFGDMREKATPFLYIPYEQGEDEFTRQSAFLVRVAGNDQQIMSSVRSIVKQFDSNIPVENVSSLRVRIDDSLFTDRIIAVLAMGFGSLATILAGVGLYGTISYSVANRTREFGVRLALGAAAENLLLLVLREVGLMIAVGAAIGLPLSYFLARLIESQLFGIHANDPWVLVGASLLIVVAGFLAGLVPAIKAMRIEPVRALRYE
jgi:predicted permease